MANQKSALISGAGWIGHFAGLLVDEMREQGFTDQEIHALVNGSKPSKDMLSQIVQSLKENQAPAFEEGEYAISLSDEQAVTWLIKKRKYDQMAAHTLVTRWYGLARKEFNYTGPVAWKVRAGFTLKQHAPKVGPCYEQFKYLQDWKFQDEPTKDCLVFWVPVIFPVTRNMKKEGQLAALDKIGRYYGLPSGHLSSLGNATFLAALILAEFKRSGKWLPANCDWVRTDTQYSDGNLLSLGNFGESGLSCHGIRDDNCYPYLGAFALGVELEP